MRMIYLFIFVLISCDDIGGPTPDDSYYITTSEAVSELEPILLEVVNGERSILSKRCGDVTYSVDANKMDVSVDGLSQLILRSDQSYNSLNYLESICKKYIYSKYAYSIVCTARTQNIDDASPSLGFYIKYGTIDGFKALYKCN